MNTKTDSGIIIPFPKMKIGTTPPQSPEEFSAKMNEYKNSYADEMAEILCSMVLAEMERSGADLYKDELGPSSYLVMESIRSLCLEANGVHHVLQDFAKETFENVSVEDILTQDDEYE